MLWYKNENVKSTFFFEKNKELKKGFTISILCCIKSTAKKKIKKDSSWKSSDERTFPFIALQHFSYILLLPPLLHIIYIPINVVCNKQVYKY